MDLDTPTTVPAAVADGDVTSLDADTTPQLLKVNFSDVENSREWQLTFPEAMLSKLFQEAILPDETLKNAPEIDLPLEVSKLVGHIRQIVVNYKTHVLEGCEKFPEHIKREKYPEIENISENMPVDFNAAMDFIVWYLKERNGKALEYKEPEDENWCVCGKGQLKDVFAELKYPENLAVEMKKYFDDHAWDTGVPTLIHCTNYLDIKDLFHILLKAVALWAHLKVRSVFVPDPDIIEQEEQKILNTTPVCSGKNNIPCVSFYFLLFRIYCSHINR